MPSHAKKLKRGHHHGHHPARARVRAPKVSVAHTEPVPAAGARSFGAHAARAAGFLFRASSAALVASLIALPLFSAFEAHVINVTATPVLLDPPVLTIPGDIGWNNLVGGTDLAGQQVVSVTTDDPDAETVYFTYTTGTTSPAAVPEPTCGSVVVPGGTGPATTTPGAVTFSFSENTVAKAVTCKQVGPSEYRQSLTNTKVYSFTDTCELPTVDWPANLAVQAAGSGSDADDVLVHSDVTVNGSVRSNHDVDAFGGGTTRTVTGDVTASGDIEVANFNISGTAATGAPTSALPDVHIPELLAAAAAGGSVAGSLVFPNNTPGIDLGPSDIAGNLSFGSNSSTTIRGTLHIHGNLTIASNVTVSQDPSMADQLTAIVVDGLVSIDANVSFVKSGSQGAFLLVSRAAAVSGSGAAIETSSNNSDLGDVVLYAEQGDVHIHSNRTLLAAFGAHGTDASEPAVQLRSNVTVNYRPLPGQLGCGLPPVRANWLVINEFVPNPAGADEGAAGDPQDGEWVELYNGFPVPVDVAGWALFDSNDSHQLLITSGNVMNTGTTSTSTVIAPGGFLVVYRNGNPDFSLQNTGDTVRLYNGSTTSFSLVDSHAYTYPGSGAPEDKSFTRMPDGTNNWVDPEPTPGEPNTERNPYFSADTAPSAVPSFAEGDEGQAEPAPDLLAGAVAGTSTDATVTTSTVESLATTSTSSLEILGGGGGGGGGNVPPAQDPAVALGTTSSGTPEGTEPLASSTPATTTPPSEPSATTTPSGTEPVGGESTPPDTGDGGTTTPPATTPPASPETQTPPAEEQPSGDTSPPPPAEPAPAPEPDPAPAPAPDPAPAPEAPPAPAAE